MPFWIEEKVRPILLGTLEKDGLQAEVEADDGDGCKLRLRYPEIEAGTGYVAPVVLLEFGGRSSGEPSEELPVVCDMAGHVQGITFPEARPRVMSLARTFWEKATAMHVFCAQGQYRGGERYSRHWHDLMAIASDDKRLKEIVANRDVARRVASHKQLFFREKDRDGNPIDYCAAVEGMLRILPEGEALVALEKDYSAMTADGVMIAGALTFEELLRACVALQDEMNRALVEPIKPGAGESAAKTD